MCGICGFNWCDKVLVRKMSDVLEHRGPDQEGFYTDDKISVGHKRLSIIDLSDGGRQPIHNEDGSIWITYNGELYNYLRIKMGLEKKGHKFYSNTDTEAIIHAYEEYGKECLNIFNGMFSFAIWDSKKKEIFLARDRLGIKPLYYYFRNGKFIFGSEIKAILQYPEIERVLNDRALAQLIEHSFTIDGQTIFDGVNELLPGSYLVYSYSDNSIDINRYWDLKVCIDDNFDESYYVKGVKKLLERSVKRRLMSDVPLGSALSGGIDCSTVVAMMSSFSDEPVKTLTTGFDDPLDEFDEARIVAEHCDTDHHEIHLSYDEVTKNLPLILWHVEIPYARPAIFSNFLLAREAKRYVTVIYCGEGSDEIFAGYNRYQIYANMPTPSLTYLKSMFNLEVYLKSIYYNLLPNERKINAINWGLFNDKTEREKIFSEKALKHTEKYNPKRTFGPYLANSRKKEQLNYALLFDIKTEIPGAQTFRVDRTGMAFSCEFRVPYLDHELVEFSTRIPPILKFNGLYKKHILQKVAKDLLPISVIKRRKFPFGLPLHKYFKDDLIEFVKYILDEKTLKRRNYLKVGYIPKLLTKIETKTKKISKMDKEKEIKDSDLRQILFLTNLELWNKIFIDDQYFGKPNLSINNYL